MSCCPESRTPAYLRVASLAIAMYDWLWTLPVEYRIYREQSSIFNLSRPCIFFILIRYVSIVTMVANNVGFFRHDIPPSVCSHYLYFAPIMKCILFLRTWAISRRSQWVFWTLAILFSVSVPVEYFVSVYKRVPVQSDCGNCTSANQDGYRVAWVFYMICMVYDTTCTAIVTSYLWFESLNTNNGQRLARLLLREGLIYFVFLTVVNILNLIVYHTAKTNAQSAAASLGYAITWIMAQRILIQLHEMRRSAQLVSAASAHTPSISASRSLSRSQSGVDRAEAQIWPPTPTHTLDLRPDMVLSISQPSESESGSRREVRGETVVPQEVTMSSRADAKCRCQGDGDGDGVVVGAGDGKGERGCV
ncbi:hypothetical protein BKA93DRAFT_397806 [Sparassis latifolia]